MLVCILSGSFLGLYSAVGSKSAQKIYCIALTALGESVLRSYATEND